MNITINPCKYHDKLGDIIRIAEDSFLSLSYLVSHCAISVIPSHNLGNSTFLCHLGKKRMQTRAKTFITNDIRCRVT